MKKDVVIISVLFLLFASFVSATEVGYVVNGDNSANPIITEILKNKGINFEIIHDYEIKKNNLNEYYAVFTENYRVKNLVIPKDIPVISMNKNYARYFGFVNYERIRIGRKNSEVLNKFNQVLSPYIFSNNVLRYYYIDQRDEGEYNIPIISIKVSDNQKGSLVSYYNQNGLRKCFFGIPEIEFWSEESKDLFGDCVDFVLGGNYEPPEEPPQQEDPECYVDEDCPEGYDCNEGVCVEIIVEPECYENADCSEGFECNEGVCKEIPEEPPIEEEGWYCAVEGTTRNDCVGFSSGLGTRCYLDEAHETWDYCSSGWVELI